MSQAARHRCRCRERRRPARWRSKATGSPARSRGRRKQSRRGAGQTGRSAKRPPQVATPAAVLAKTRRPANPADAGNAEDAGARLRTRAGRGQQNCAVGNQKKRPRISGAFFAFDQQAHAETRTALRGGFCRPSPSTNLPQAWALVEIGMLRGFLGLGDLADEIGREAGPFLERSVLHHDEIGKLECPLEGARPRCRDTAPRPCPWHFSLADFSPLIVSVFSLATIESSPLRETGNRNADAVGVLAGAPRCYRADSRGCRQRLAWSRQGRRRSGRSRPWNDNKNGARS